MPRLAFHVPLSGLFRILLSRPAPPTGPQTAPPHEIEAARRAWLNETICANPDGFGSELDVRDLMSGIPGGL